ncbi:MBL fold metallo-hydrolase [Brevibacillus brevis]|uniref:MBL fold metallo-hydrolase n=1 Tax=Brevibacillus brevis TaxID=1393 RepID=A0ABY9SX49_BREBE|nr:MBL fold metallo-hydrolase [Brevibacillus brevis]WNC12288.1 MBL fold metallo-hydrolase [Brevibacillus brevis]
MTEWINGVAKLSIPTPFPVGDVNVYLLKGDRLTLVDTGPNTIDAWDSLRQQLKYLGVTTSDIEQIILTHHHPDHAGLLEFFPVSTEVYGHPLNDRWLSQFDSFLAEQDPFFVQLCKEFGAPVEYPSQLVREIKRDYTYSSNRDLTGHLVTGATPLGQGDWVVLETPGHAQSHISLYREKDGVFIGGDHLLHHISPNPCLEPPLPGETERPQSIFQYNQSLYELLKLPIRLVYAGHGKEIYDTNQRIQDSFLHQQERSSRIMKWLETESLTAFEVCQRLFPHNYQHQLYLSMSETVAQFDYLTVLEGIRVFKEGSGEYRYSAHSG